MIHKHIARHTKKYVKHFTKYLYERDTIFATIAVFIFLVLLGMIPINFYVLNPMKLALKDFDFNDITYAKLEKGKDNPVDSRMVIVNIGHLDRAGIGFLIDKINSYHPKVIGLDTWFENEKDPEKDSILREAFLRTKNLVAVSVIVPEKHDFSVQKNYFDDVITKRGYANLIGEEVGTIRNYSPFEMVNGEKYPQITTAIIREFDSVAYQKLVKRGKEVETINYTRRVNQYQIIDHEDLMMDNVEGSLLKDKIVLMGYINPDQNDIEDKKFTPMNARFAGKSLPDMNGIVVQANIISMVLDGNYIKKTPKFVAWLLAIIIGWAHMSLFIRFYLEDHIWFHLVAKLAQVFSAIFFAYLGMEIFDKFGVKLDMKYTLYVIVLAVDVIYFYEAFVTWMHKKFKYQTIFGHHHHPVEPDARTSH
ncbi:MAG TPA: CHASE2 domain-containing protein [Chitinophagaceae bacterium]|nr:CHASE2 domain-containing protein [Chitinophagaceae bacterium]